MKLFAGTDKKPTKRDRTVQIIISLPPANEVWGKVIFSVACVKNSVHRGWGLPQGMLRYPLEQAPPSKNNPLGTRHPPPEQCMLGDTVNKQAVCILLECNLV